MVLYCYACQAVAGEVWKSLYDSLSEKIDLVSVAGKSLTRGFFLLFRQWNYIAILQFFAISPLHPRLLKIKGAHECTKSCFSLFYIPEYQISKPTYQKIFKTDSKCSVQMLHHILLATVGNSLSIPHRPFRKQKYPTFLHHLLKFYQLPLTNPHLTQDYSLPVFLTRKLTLTLMVISFFGFLN